MRKKYDAVVEYTVHLTAERDYHFTQLEELKKQVQNEKMKKSKQNVSTNGQNMGSDSMTRMQGEHSGKREVIVQQGFSFIVVIIVAVISFLIAKYLS